MVTVWVLTEAPVFMLIFVKPGRLNRQIKRTWKRGAMTATVITLAEKATNPTANERPS
jgi:hypothetical protein